MSVVVVGLEHRRVPLDLLERVCVDDAQVGKVLGVLRDRENFGEAVVLSTCLRTEVYAVVDRFHEAVEDLQLLLADRAGVGVDALEGRVDIRFDDDVPSHLFAVASGLESVVLGESEILGQVRRAAAQAEEERATGPVLVDLFRHAVRTGRRVRTETAIARGTTSFAHGALELAEDRRSGGLAGATVAVVGAGEIGSGVVTALAGLPASRAPARLLLVNRTASRAQELAGRAARPDGPLVEVVPWAEGQEAVAGADVAVTALAAEAGVLPNGWFTARGPARSLLVVDLGMPRNVAPAVGEHAGVTLLDLEDLRDATERALEGRRAEVDGARRIVAEEVSRYRAASRARGAAPVVAALRARMEVLRQGELDRRRSRSALDDEEWAEVDAVTRAVLAKLLHEPTVALKDTAGTTRGERLVEALRVLFDL